MAFRDVHGEVEEMFAALSVPTWECIGRGKSGLVPRRRVADDNAHEDRRAQRSDFRTTARCLGKCRECGRPVAPAPVQDGYQLAMGALGIRAEVPRSRASCEVHLKMAVRRALAARAAREALDRIEKPDPRQLGLFAAQEVA